MDSLLLRLSQHDSQDDDIAPITTEDLDCARLSIVELEDAATASEFWKSLTQAGASTVAYTKALGQLVRDVSISNAACAAAFYSTLLRANGCQASTLFDPFTFTGFMHALKKTASQTEKVAEQPTKKAKGTQRDGARKGGRRKAKGDDEDDDDEDDETDRAGSRKMGSGQLNMDCVALCTESLANLHLFVQKFSMREYNEMLTMMVETCVEITRIGALSGSGSTTGRARSRHNGANNPAEAAYLVLCALLDDKHGDLCQTAALIMQRLMPTLLGVHMTTAASKRAATQEGQQRRAACMQFIQAVYREHASTMPGVCALVRQLCMRAHDKADLRAAAVASMQELVLKLPPMEQLHFSTFLFRLSRSARPAHRLMAVEAAQSLLLELPAPFAAESGWKPFINGSHGPGEEILAPWAAICCTLLLQRCEDKAPAVRARALTHTAEMIETFTRLMEVDQAAGDGGDKADAAAGAVSRCFLMALCGSGHLKMHIAQVETQVVRRVAQQQRLAAGAKGLKKAAKAGKKGGKGRKGRAAEESSSEDDDDDVVEEEAAVDNGRDEGEMFEETVMEVREEVVGTLPSRIKIDLAPIVTVAHRRLRDDKAPARRAALSVLEAVLLLRGKLDAPVGSPPTEADIAAVEAATADPLVSVRKAALAAVSRMVSCFPADPACCELWVRAALPLVRDPEVSIQEALLDQVSSLLLDRAAATTGSGLSAANALREVRPLLASLSAAGRGAAGCLAKAVSLLSQKKALRAKQVAKGVEGLISAALRASAEAATAAGGDISASVARIARAEAQGAWILLKEVAACDPSAPSWQFLQAAWARLQEQGRSAAAEEGAALLWVISHAAEGFPADDAASLAKDLLQALMAFSLPAAAASAHVAALNRLTASSSDEDEAAGKGKGGHGCGGKGGVGTPMQWTAKVLEGVHEVLSKAMDKRGQLTDATQAWRISCALFIAGEVALLRQARVPSGLVVLIQALTALGSTSGPSAAAVAALLGTQEPLPSQLDASGATQAQGTQPATMAGAQAASVAGYAWIALGKLCLVDENLAKRAAPLFVQELSRATSPVVRNNCLVALTDMCIHFTALVDGYLPRLASLIRDPHELVRRQALALLANLLMKDYVKWRGALFHRFCIALVDSSHSVRQLAEYLLGDTLASKAPLLAYNHFVEALFVLNGCQGGLHGGRIGGDPAAGADGSAAPVSEAFTLKGATPAMRARRDVVYHTLLRRMSPEHKFATQAKLVQEVLGAVADGVLVLQEPGAEEVLGDALRLLGSKEIKVNAAKMVASDEDAMMAAAGDAAAGATQAVAEVAKAKGKLVSAMMKKHLVEGVVPLLVELKAMLSEARHPLLGTLMQCMAAMLKDYKAELEDILVENKQLAKEILFDLKQAEQMAKQQQHSHAAAAAAAAAIASTPGRAGSATPIADEVLATAAKQKQAATAAAAARRAGSAMSTPGAGIAAPGSATGAMMSPGAALLARRTPGIASIAAQDGRTPIARGIRHTGLAAAPVSVAKAAQVRAAAAMAAAAADVRGAAAVLADDDDFVGDVAVLPAIPADDSKGQQGAGEKQWGVALDCEDIRGSGGRRTQDRKSSRSGSSKAAAAEAATRAVLDATGTEENDENGLPPGHDTDQGGKHSSRASSHKRGSAAAAAKSGSKEVLQEVEPNSLHVASGKARSTRNKPNIDSNLDTGRGPGGSKKGASGKADVTSATTLGRKRKA